MTERTCSVEGCGRGHFGRGLCSMHYKRAWKNNALPDVKAYMGGLCSVDGCDRKHQARGWCKYHHARWLRRDDPLAPALRQRNPSTCSVAGCSLKPVARELCARHLHGMDKYGDPLAGNPPNRLRCAICDTCQSDPGGSMASAARLLGSAGATIKRHRAHVDDPAWHIARAEWWAKELAALQAEVEQVGEA